MEIIVTADRSGLFEGLLVLESNDDTLPRQTISLSGSFLEPDAAATPLSLELGPVVSGQVSTGNISLSNQGDGTLVGSLSLTVGGAFEISENSVQILPSQSVELSVIYSPDSLKVSYDTLRITTNDPNVPLLVIPLQGMRATSAVVTHPDLIELVPTVVGDTLTHTFIVGNDGDDTLSVDEIRVDGIDHATVSLASAEILPDQSIEVIFTITPISEGPYSGHLVLATNASGQEQLEIPVSGLVVGDSPIVMDLDNTPDFQGLVHDVGLRIGDKISIQLFAKDVPDMDGWSATVEYDSTVVAYKNGSFAVGDFIAGLVPLVDEGIPGTISVGGAVLGQTSSASGTGYLGSLDFTVLDVLDTETQIRIFSVGLKRTDGTEDKRIVFEVVTLSFAKKLAADFDGSGKVDFSDFFLFADAFGGTDSTYDFDGSGRVDPSSATETILNASPSAT